MTPRVLSIVALVLLAGCGGAPPPSPPAPPATSPGHVPGVALSDAPSSAPVDERASGVRKRCPSGIALCDSEMQPKPKCEPEPCVSQPGAPKAP